MSPIDLLWLFIIFSSLQPVFRMRLLEAQRMWLFRKFEEQRKSRAIGLIHRQETMSFLGFPIARYIDIEDSERLLRAIQLTDPTVPIDLILHTPGGLVLAASQIAQALRDHDGRVTAVVPHYAMSGGTLIALAADEIVIDRHAALGPVDPQLGQYAAASLVEVAKLPGDHDDQTLLMADIGRKALRQVESLATGLLERHMEHTRAQDVGHLLSSGVWTHDHPLMAAELERFGLPVKIGVPAEERTLMNLYPQPRGREPAVEWQPGPPMRPGLPPGRNRSRRNARR
jgi:ClpP class serine protease